MVEAAHLERAGEGQGVLRAAEIAGALALGVRLHVVDRREVEEVIDGSGMRLYPGGLYAEAGFREVSLDR